MDAINSMSSIYRVGRLTMEHVGFGMQGTPIPIHEFTFQSLQML